MNCGVKVGMAGSVGGLSEGALTSLPSFVHPEEFEEEGGESFSGSEQAEENDDKETSSLLMEEELLRSNWQPLESPSAQLARYSLLSDLGVDIESIDGWSALLTPSVSRQKSIDLDSCKRQLGNLAQEDAWDISDRPAINIDGSMLISPLDTFQKKRTSFMISSHPNLTSSAAPSSPSFATGLRCIDKLFSDFDDSLGVGDCAKALSGSSEGGDTLSVSLLAPTVEFEGPLLFSTCAKKARPTFSHWNRQGLCETIKPAGRMSTVPSLTSFPRIRRSASEYCSASSSSAASMAASRGMSPTMGEISHLLQSYIGAEPCLPCFDSPRDAIKRITPTVLTEILAGSYAHRYKRLVIVDCRYPYEYHGGHLPGAINICSLDGIDQMLFSPKLLQSKETMEGETHSTVVIFHCEFSSERAPRMALHVRNYDRMINAADYPHLYYPQVYILDGGYKKFFVQYPAQCDPPGQYVPMRNVHNREELKQHQRQKFHDGQLHGKHRHKLRSCSLRKSHSIAMPHPVSAISTFFRTREGTVATGMLPGEAMSLTGAMRSTVELLSSDIGEIYDQTDTILQAAEHFLLTDSALTEGRVSK